MSKVILNLRKKGWLLQVEFRPQDLWLGVFWINKPTRIDVWVCVIPCFPIHYASPISWMEEKK